MVKIFSCRTVLNEGYVAFDYVYEHDDPAELVVKAELLGNKLCSTCLGDSKVIVHPIYVNIINKLNVAGLLPNDYRIICCLCFEKQRIKGL